MSGISLMLGLGSGFTGALALKVVTTVANALMAVAVVILNLLFALLQPLSIGPGVEFGSDFVLLALVYAGALTASAVGAALFDKDEQVLAVADKMP